MTKFSDAISDDSLQNLAQNTVEIGNVYRITMRAANGIILKKGDKSRDKFFVVLGYDNKGAVFGGVIINSKINKNLPNYIKCYHMPISKTKYSFLAHNSFVDCVQLKKAFPKNFNEWTYIGKIEQDDVDLIIGTVRESPKETVSHLALYGL